MFGGIFVLCACACARACGYACGKGGEAEFFVLWVRATHFNHINTINQKHSGYNALMPYLCVWVCVYVCLCV